MKVAKIIGLTGNIGSGKSTVAKLFALHNWPVFDSDKIGKLLIKENRLIQQTIITTFGDNILSSKNQIDNSKLAQLVFNDKTKLEELNKIIHPEVKMFFKNWLNNQNSDFIIRESAILFEVGIYSESFKNIVVTCPLEERIKRILLRGGINRAEIEKRDKAQLAESIKIEKSDLVINNFEEALIPQVEKIKSQLLTMKNS